MPGTGLGHVMQVYSLNLHNNPLCCHNSLTGEGIASIVVVTMIYILPRTWEWHLQPYGCGLVEKIWTFKLEKTGFEYQLYHLYHIALWPWASQLDSLSFCRVTSISHDLEGELNTGWVLNTGAAIILIAITHAHSYTVYYSTNVTQCKLDKR